MWNDCLQTTNTPAKRSEASGHSSKQRMPYEVNQTTFGEVVTCPLLLANHPAPTLSGMEHV